MASLADLLPTSVYKLAYTLPLFFISLVLAFAGCFLTLQRTRSFAPRHDAMQLPGALTSANKKSSIQFYLEGGAGGMGVGYTLGLHIATFLSLLIPNETVSVPLSANAFTAVWVLSCIATSLLAGRFKYAALAAAGITGGASLALALCVAIHPPLLARRVILGLAVAIMSLLALIPFSCTQERSLRLSISAVGAFGFVISIAILADVTAWSEIWARLWDDTSITWGTGGERGLSAGFWLLLVLGYLFDWALKHYFGGDPDQKWDAYLAEYTTSLPHFDDRAGTFQPNNTTLWERVTHLLRRHPSKESFPPMYPLGDGTKTSMIPSPPFTEKHVLEEYDKPRFLEKSSERPIARLRALARESSGRKREAVKFHPLTSAASDALSSDDEDDHSLPLYPPFLRRHDMNRTDSTASKTLINGSDASSNYDKEYVRLSGAKEALTRELGDNAVSDYSDFEDDVTSFSSIKRGEPGWRPPFIANERGYITEMSAAMPPSPGTSPGTVPLTSSLVVAVHPAHLALPAITETRGEHWDTFWHDIVAKVRQ